MDTKKLTHPPAARIRFTTTIKVEGVEYKAGDSVLRKALNPGCVESLERLGHVVDETEVPTIKPAPKAEAKPEPKPAAKPEAPKEK